MLLSGRPSEFAWCAWSEASARRLEAPLGCPSGQTTWEYFALLLALTLWATRFRKEGLAVLGDNLSSLNALLSLKGRNQLSKVTRELAWSKTRYAWRYAAGHLPSELNTLADSLSRVAAPAGHAKEVPSELDGALRRDFPDQDGIWAVPD